MVPYFSCKSNTKKPAPSAVHYFYSQAAALRDGSIFELSVMAPHFSCKSTTKKSQVVTSCKRKLGIHIRLITPLYFEPPCMSRQVSWMLKYGARQPSVLTFQSHAAENHYAEFDDTHSWSSRVRQIESAAMVNASSSSEFTTQIVIILGCFWNYPLTPQGRHAWQICHTIAVVLIFQLPDKSHRNPVSLAHRYNHKMKHTARNQSVEALLFVLLSSLEFLV